MLINHQNSNKNLKSFLLEERLNQIGIALIENNVHFAYLFLEKTVQGLHGTLKLIQSPVNTIFFLPKSTYEI